MIDSKKIINVFYASHQSYTFHLSKLLFERYKWCPKYWLVDTNLRQQVQETFPDCITHNYIDSVKGIPPDIFSGAKFLPISPELIFSLEKHQKNAIFMMERNDSNSSSFGYKERLEFYYTTLSYWKFVLADLDIDLVLFEEEPHQATDYILYILCGYLGIRTIVFVRTISNLGIIPMERFEDGSPILERAYSQAMLDYKNGNQHSIPQMVQDYFNTLNGAYDNVLKEHLWDQVEKVKRLQGQGKDSKLLHTLSKALSSLDVKKMKHRFKLLLGEYNSDQKVWYTSIYRSHQSYVLGLYYKFVTIWRKARLEQAYKKLSEEFMQNDSKYILCALQYQPEKTTTPLGGIFQDQYLMVDLIANSVPAGWKVLVKEHPSQFVFSYTRYGETFRSKDYYKRLLRNDNVELVPMSEDIFDLIDKSEAVASIGGTICWEALARGRPALTFGLSWYRNCEGVFYIQTESELQNALEMISKGYSVDRNAVKIFASCIYKLGLQAAIGGKAQLDHKFLTSEQNALLHHKAIELILSD